MNLSLATKSVLRTAALIALTPLSIAHSQTLDSLFGADKPAAPAVAAVPAPPPVPPIGFRLISVYGPEGALTAEIVDTKGDYLFVKEGEILTNGAMVKTIMPTKVIAVKNKKESVVRMKMDGGSALTHGATTSAMGMPGLGGLNMMPSGAPLTLPGPR